jgi:hypothetical protein
MSYKVCEFFGRASARGAACQPKQRHCEKRRDEAISMIRRKWREIASLRSQ